MVRRSLALALVLVLAACAGGSTVAPGPSASAVSSARAELAGVEIEPTARGEAANRAMTARAWSRVRPAIADMCAHFDAEGCDYALVWSAETTPNAFADGETIYMFDGLVRYLENEAEVALVLAHEAAHNVAEHPAKGARNTALGTAVGAVLGGVLAAVIDDDLAGEGVALGAAVGGTTGRLSYSKTYEREADYVGAYIVDHAGYDLAAARGLYRVLGGLSGVDTTSIFDSHPASPDRLAGFDAAAAEIRAGSRWPRLEG
jgi:predicted Zn-dependent protease